MSVFSNDDNKIINFRPICVGAVCFLMGIFCAFCVVVERYLMAVLPPFVLFAILIIVKLVGGRGLKFSLWLVGCFFLIFAVGVGSFMVRSHLAMTARAPKESGIFVGTVSEVKRYDEHAYRIIFRNCSVDGESFNGKSVCYIQTYNIADSLEVGNQYYFKCEIESRFESERDEHEIYKGVHFSVDMHGKMRFLKDDANLFEVSKRFISSLLKDGMSEDGYALALALTVGDTSSLSYDALSNYRMAGIAHVFAVSGLHVGTLALVLSFIAKKLKLKSLGVLIFTAVPLLFYCGICGFSPSSLRAFIMSVSLLLAGVVGFKRDSLSALSIAAVLIALINPVCIFEKGFQLSFVCVISIVILAPVFTRGSSDVVKGTNPVATALSVQVGTLPIITDMCGYMSIISLLCNIVFVPIIMICYQILMVSAGIGAVEFALFSTSNHSLFLIDKVLNLLSEFINLFSFENAIIPMTFGWVSAIYYVGVVVISDVVNIGVKNKIAIGGICGILTILLLIF